MTDSVISSLLRSSLPVLNKKISALSADPANAILSYQRIVSHLETLLPAVCAHFGNSSGTFPQPSSKAWWSSRIPGTTIFVELEKRYFSDPVQPQTLTGTNRADVVLTLHQHGRRHRILLEYKTTSSNGTLDESALKEAFSEQLIPYLNYEVAGEIQSDADANDDFICCIAVHLREDTGSVAVAPHLAYSLKRNPEPPPGKSDDPNQHCFFAFHKWPDPQAPVTFTEWLLQQIGLLGQVTAAAPPAAETGVVHIVYGPPGSGKSSWVNKHRPRAKVFAPPALRARYVASAPPESEPIATSLVIEEWQHFDKWIFGSHYQEAITALEGKWNDLTVVTDFGQAREDNHNFSVPYEKISKFIDKHAKRPLTYRMVPLWIPLRQVHLGVAFMLWVEAVRRALKSASKKESPYLSPPAAARGFVKARQLLINLAKPDHELFDIRIVRLADLSVSAGGISIGSDRVDIALQLQPTNAEKGKAPPITTGVLSSLIPLTKHPVDIAGLEYDSILVRMEKRVFAYSNQINEILLACTRARRRLWILVDDNWRGGATTSDDSLVSLYKHYDEIGLGEFRDEDSPA